MRGRLRLSKTIEVILFLLIGAVVLFPPRGCSMGDISVRTSTLPSHKASGDSSNPETIYFLEASQVKTCSVGRKDVHEVFTTKGTVDLRSFITFYPRTSKFIYATTNIEGAQEIHELPMKGRDVLIDKDVTKVYPAGIKGSVFYTKGDGRRNNKLYYYEDSRPPRYLKIDNVEGLVYSEADVSEFCYSSFSPNKGLCKIYIGRIDSSKKDDLIAEFPANRWCQPVKLTKDIIIYTLNEPHNEEGAAVYALDRKNRRNTLLANNAALLDIAHIKDMVLVVLRTPGNVFHCLEIWRVDAKDGSKQQLVSIKDAKVTEARFTPEADGFVFVHDAYRKLSFYGFKDRHTKDLVCVSKGAIKEFSFGEDGKAIFYVLEGFSGAEAYRSRSIYNVHLVTGKRSLIYRINKPKHPTFLHVIEPSKSELCAGEH